MDFNKEMDQLETSIEALRARYRMYFAGSQAEPLQYRWQLEAAIRRFQKETVTNPAQANRFRAILQKYGNYRALWNRLRREKLKAKGKIAEKELDEEFIKELEESGLGEELDEALEKELAESGPGEAEAPPAAPPAPPPPPAVPAPVPASATPPARAPAVPQEEFRGLFEEYVKARGTTGESQDISFGKFQGHMYSQQEALRGRYPGKEYSFRVVVKDGKVTLAAELKKS